MITCPRVARTGNTIGCRSPRMGPQQTSPGHRPGFVVPQFFPSPDRVKQRNAICFALSGLVHVFATLSQGVALGWFVVAPSGRHRTGLWLRSVFCAVAILLFAVGLPSFAAESRLADAAQRCISPEGAATDQPRATPWVSERNDDKP